MNTVAKIHKIARAAAPTAEITARLWDCMLMEHSQPALRTVSSGHFKDVVGRLLSEGGFHESFSTFPERTLRN
ncbi:MAG: hypothetical protein MUO76_02955, partial [Anaerolineaceae bacterium]|nr:hypothetical protein [Anaerolineaceae bacterium]